VRKNISLIFGIGLVLIVAGVLFTFGLFRENIVSQPMAACQAAPRKPLTTAPVPLSSAQDYYVQGDYDYEQGDCDKAIADYSRAIELNPNLAEAYNNRAYVYMVKQNYAAALYDLNRALQIRPSYVNALMNRADIYNYYYEINYARAVADYDQVLKIDPNAAQTTSVCGHRLLALNHGWNLNVLGSMFGDGAMAGCPKTLQ